MLRATGIFMMSTIINWGIDAGLSEEALQVVVLLLEMEELSTAYRDTGDPICGLTFAMVLRTWRASSFKSIASYFAYLSN